MPQWKAHRLAPLSLITYERGWMIVIVTVDVTILCVWYHWTVNSILHNIPQYIPSASCFMLYVPWCIKREFGQQYHSSYAREFVRMTRRLIVILVVLTGRATRSMNVTTSENVTKIEDVISRKNVPVDTTVTQQQIAVLMKDNVDPIGNYTNYI